MPLAQEPQEMLALLFCHGHLYHDHAHLNLVSLILELALFFSLWLERVLSEKDRDHNIRIAIIDPKGLEKSMMESIATASKSFCCIVFVSLVLNCFDDFRSDAKLLPREEDGEFLLSRDEEHLVVYNSKDETSRDMVVCGIPGSFTFGGTYVESLISPERIHGIGRQCEACERMKRTTNKPREGKHAIFKLWQCRSEASESSHYLKVLSPRLLTWKCDRYGARQRILQVMVETYEAGTCQSSTNKQRYRVEPSSSSSNIEASTSRLTMLK
ncbi:hypothetical protein LOK49_LG12G02751 [Camellia lanceoleosa]|uniref:Uncharacterized protein n=1 Tax=Camellia lanceoleosa TaxID=1840588 RepID=A0ACC0FS60_9ERIC|nr:hypothetical protein LOK49_LG12G02751 [Camellia lanceoleosa]